MMPFTTENCLKNYGLRSLKGTEIYSEAAEWWHTDCQRTLLTIQLISIDVWCRSASALHADRRVKR